MAKVKIEEIVDHLSSEMRRALAETFATVAPGVQVDDRELFREFKRNVYRKCNIWENVPDRYVEKD